MLAEYHGWLHLRVPAGDTTLQKRSRPHATMQMLSWPDNSTDTLGPPRDRANMTHHVPAQAEQGSTLKHPERTDVCCEASAR